MILYESVFSLLYNQIKIQFRFCLGLYEPFKSTHVAPTYSYRSPEQTNVTLSWWGHARFSPTHLAQVSVVYNLQTQLYSGCCPILHTGPLSRFCRYYLSFYTTVFPQTYKVHYLNTEWSEREKRHSNCMLYWSICPHTIIKRNERCQHTETQRTSQPFNAD